MRYTLILALVPTLALALKFPDSPALVSSGTSDIDPIEASSDTDTDQSSKDAVRVIDEILAASKEGRSVNIALGEADLDKLANDPELKKLTAEPETQGRSLGTASSSDYEARNYITNRLCSLGLARCGEQRSYGHSGNGFNAIRDVTLVQPVALKPIGHPIAAIPLESGNVKGSIPFSPTFGSQKNYDNGYYPSETQGGFISTSGPRCTCVPVSQCNSYDIVSSGSGGNYNNYQGSNQYENGNSFGSGNYNGGNYNGGNGNYNGGNSNYNGGSGNYNGGNYNGNSNNFLTGNGRPSYGQVGQGIDPRNKLNSDIESNATIVEAPESALNARSVDESTTEVSSNRTRREAPRVVNGASNQCYDRQVCCRYPQGPVNKNPSYNPGGPSSYPPYYPSNNNNFNGNSGNYNGGGFQGGNGNSGGRGVCGKRNAYGINGRVLNGQPSNYAIGNGDTEFGEYPWQVAILRKEGGDNVFVCGGSLIDNRHVLTAAHCIQSHRPQALRVRLGDWDVGGETEFYQHQDLDVAAIAVHPDFNSGNLFNDIALIKLDGYVDTGRFPHISSICMPDKYYDFSGKRCIVTGWGKDAWGHEGKFQHRLKEVDLPVLNHYDCEQKLKRTRLGSNFVLHPGFMCAGGEPNRDACKGDGGGPLACEVGGVWQLAGIISWGVGCGQPDVPGVYVRVSNYHDWIRSNIGY